MKINFKLLIVAFLILGFSVSSCRKENGTTTTTPPVNLLQQKWNFDSVNTKVTLNTQLVMDSTENQPAGSYVYFYSDTKLETYDPTATPMHDTFDYININNQKIVSNMSGQTDTADIVTLTEKALVLNAKLTQDTIGLNVLIDLNLYMSR